MSWFVQKRFDPYYCGPGPITSVKSIVTCAIAGPEVSVSMAITKQPIMDNVAIVFIVPPHCVIKHMNIKSLGTISLGSVINFANQEYSVMARLIYLKLTLIIII